MPLSADPILPPPPPEAAAHSRRARRAHRRRDRRRRATGSRSRATWSSRSMRPGLGYYAAGARKFGAEGDFVTSPEISPMFAQVPRAAGARRCSTKAGGDILELGPGSGVLAADLFGELKAQGAAPERYLLLEVSPDLRERQRALHRAERFPRRPRPLRLARRAAGEDPRLRDRQRGARRGALRARASPRGRRARARRDPHARRASPGTTSRCPTASCSAARAR